MRSIGFLLRVRVPEGSTADEVRADLLRAAEKVRGDLSETIHEEHGSYATHVSRHKLMAQGRRTR